MHVALTVNEIEDIITALEAQAYSVFHFFGHHSLVEKLRRAVRIKHGSAAAADPD